MGRKKKTEELEVIPEEVLKTESSISLDSFSEPSQEPNTLLDDTSITVDTNMPQGDLPPQKRKYTKRKDKDKPSEEPLIDGETIMMFCDMLIPMTVAAVNNSMSDNKINPDDMVLTAKIYEKMKVFADRCAERINMNVNPFLALGIGLSGAYTMNYFAAKREATKTK